MARPSSAQASYGTLRDEHLLVRFQAVDDGTLARPDGEPVRLVVLKPLVGADHDRKPVQEKKARFAGRHSGTTSRGSNWIATTSCKKL